MQVKAQEQRTATDAAAAAAGSQQQVIAGDPASLETLELPETDLPPTLATLNLTKLAPALPLVAGLNASVLVSWVDVIERTPPETLSLLIPALNGLNASTLEAFVAAVPYLNWETVLVVLPLVNALPASTLAAYINLLQDVSGRGGFSSLALCMHTLCGTTYILAALSCWCTNKICRDLALFRLVAGTTSLLSLAMPC